MNPKVAYVGCSLDVGAVFSHGMLAIDCKEGRREQLVGMVEEIEKKGCLDPALASKLRALCRLYVDRTVRARL